jgi:hypothetical protein
MYSTTDLKLDNRKPRESHNLVELQQSTISQIDYSSDYQVSELFVELNVPNNLNSREERKKKIIVHLTTLFAILFFTFCLLMIITTLVLSGRTNEKSIFFLFRGKNFKSSR